VFKASYWKTKNVSEDGGAVKDVNTRIQKARIASPVFGKSGNQLIFTKIKIKLRIFWDVGLLPCS
jgi:hypothetical protein